MLGLSRSVATDDRTVLLEAYRVWGVSFVERLLGEFALVLWDQRRRSLVCARDQEGMRQLYYCQGADGSLFVASTVGGLLALADVPKDLDHRRLAEFVETPFAESGRTFYRAIRRLPAAHLMRCGAKGVAIRRFWSLDPERELRLGSDRDYEYAFRELFIDAVRVRLRGSSRIGCNLSGGLDSSSVACAAESLLKQRVPTFSLVCTATPECDERWYIEQVLRGRCFEPHMVDTARLRPFLDWERVLEVHDEPPSGPNVYLRWAIHHEAAKSGVRALLGGFDGDWVVSHGFGRLADLAETGRWARCLAETVCLSWRLRRSPWRVFRNKVVAPLAPGLRAQWRRLNGRCTPPLMEPNLLLPDFRREVGLESVRSRPRPSPCRVGERARSEHLERLADPVRDRVTEMAARTANAFGVEVRNPFEDRRLKEFCLAIPTDQKFRWGWPRSILRRGLRDLLPDPVRRRTTKANFGPLFQRGMVKGEARRLEYLMGRPLERLSGCVDLPRLRELHHRCMLRPHENDLVVLFRIASLVMWLERKSINTI
jgi:asparagine synthase (glutamine-hydrolysing)